MDNFVHLHVHSDYSALDGACTVKNIVTKVAKLDQPAVAITEHGNVDSAFKFYTECKKRNIKPILGCEMYFAPLGIDTKNDTNPIMHIVLLAKNYKGWENLLQLIAAANINGFYYKPRIDFALLEKYKEGLILLTACLQGPIAYHLRRGEDIKAIELSDKFKAIFGNDYYIEIMNHGLSDQRDVVPKLYAFANTHGLKTVATNDTHYIDKEDSTVHEILLCENMKKSIYDRTPAPSEFYIKSRSEMLDFVPDTDTLNTTLEIADKCNVEFPQRDHILPKTFEKEFDMYVKFGKNKYRHLFQDIRYCERLEHELDVVKAANLTGYFLTVHDFIRHARANDIAVGPGRGSVGGSLLAFILGITAVDPIKYNLMFGRFYNAGRKKSLPDIDIDFSARDIDRMLEYVRMKYGQYNVCHIGTVNTYAPKGALKAICRVHSVPFQEANRLTDLIDHKAKKLKDELQDNPKVKAAYYTDSTPYSRHLKFRDLYDMAMKIEGMISHKGVHAAGVIIAPMDLRELIPMRRDKNAPLFVSCWSMDDLEAIGLVKYDFLRLDNLDAINGTLERINKRIEEIPIDTDDPKVRKAYKLLTKTTNVGIFQLSSPDGSRIINRLRPVCMEDIAVGITLNRPGCINTGLHEKYIMRKNGEEDVSYQHDILKPILGDSYGVTIYQEQIIKICMQMAGFTESEADTIRKAMGKKRDDLMKSMKENFIDGSIKRNIPKYKAEEIWDMICEFSEYAFNKAHAVGYAHISYYCAYLKANYTAEYMASLLNTAISDPDKLRHYFNDCRRCKLTIELPDVNHSKADFDNGKKSIRYGLMGIKGLGEETVKDIINNRPYADLFEFVHKSGLGVSTVTLLAHAGALDSFGYSRKAIANNAEAIVKKAKTFKKKQEPVQRKLFSTTPTLTIKDEPEYEIDELLEKEFGAIQSYITADPLERYYKWIDHNITDREMDDENYVTAGYVQTYEEKISAKGKEYLELILYTPTKTERILLFKEICEQTKQLLKKHKAFWIKGLKKEDVVLGNGIGLLTEEKVLI